MYFDSRSLRCKDPYGAVPFGTDVTLTIYAGPYESVTKAFLSVHLVESG